MSGVKIVAASEDSLQIQFDQKICPEVNHQISVFCRAFELMTKDMPEIIEIVPTYCAVSIYFDEKSASPELIRKVALEVLEKMDDKEGSGVRAGEGDLPEGGRIISIPVCYEDQEFAPDLEKVCAHAKMTKEDVIRLHFASDYLIYMMGFLPGFPYLGGMDERLNTPRLESPRTKIPAGSLAIGGAQTGLYPVESPGGWNIIGRTPLKLFDLSRTPRFLYRAGDKILFVPISRQEFDSFDENSWLKEELGVEGAPATGAASASAASAATCMSAYKKESLVCGGGIKILEAGLLTTVQDSGTRGFQKYGISQSGAMDMTSFRLANRLCGNDQNAACLETTLSGPTLTFVNECDFALTGAVFEAASLDGQSIEMNKKYHAAAGSKLSCGFASKGLRSYIAFSGGILVPEFFASRSTNLKSKSGGYYGRKLQAGDQLALGYKKEGRASGQEAEKTEEAALVAGGTVFPGEILTLNCQKSSQTDFFDEECLKRFTSLVYTIAPQSDRMGIRFTGESLNCGKTDIISDAIPLGAVQITSAGLPVVMASDRQTTGGYAKIACVKKESMCCLAQALPGTKVRFNLEEKDD